MLMPVPSLMLPILCKIKDARHYHDTLYNFTPQKYHMHMLTLQVAMCLDVTYYIILIYLTLDNFTSQGESAASIVQ